MAKNQFKLNGYDLALKMRKSRRKYALNSTDQALYYELIAICNEDGWDRYFKCSNWELCNALKISENTLVKSRKQLIAAELIYYKSGKSKREYSTYSFLTTSKSEVVPEVNNEVDNSTTPLTTEQSTSNDEVKAEVKAADYYKEKEKLKKNNIYISEEEFLKRWKDAREHYDRKTTNISKLKFNDRNLFEELAKKYTAKQFDNAIGGLFFQKTYPATRVQPSHFLENFEQYYDCWKNKEKLYEGQNSHSSRNANENKKNASDRIPVGAPNRF